MSPVAFPSTPIGIFDSGIGGLSVLRHIRDLLPHEPLIYVADSAYAPYGDKQEEDVVKRIIAVAGFLLARQCKALVVACNTGTAAAIHLLRDKHPDWPIVGVEPGLKPAAQATKTGIVGVLATDRTLSSDKFQALRDRLGQSTGVTFLRQPCTGLAARIEAGELASPETESLVHRYVAPLIAQNADTLVLGCTHYPFVREQIEQAARLSGGGSLSIIDTGQAVARQLARLLAQHHLVCSDSAAGDLQAYTTGDPAALASAFGKLLQLHPQVEKIAV